MLARRYIEHRITHSLCNMHNVRKSGIRKSSNQELVEISVFKQSEQKLENLS